MLLPMPKMVSRIDTAERFMFLDCVCSIARDGLDQLDGLAGLDRNGDQTSSAAQQLVDWLGRATIDWNVPLRMGNSWYDRMVDACRTPTRPERKESFSQISAEIKKLAAQAKDVKSLVLSFLGNPRKAVSERVGMIFVALLLPAMNVAVDAEDRGAMQFEVTKLGFALAAFRAEHGSYPAKLSELSPAYVATVPEDVFSGKPLRYQRQGDGFVLYSVGLNGIDDGAKSYADRKNGEEWDDLAVRVPAKE